MESSQLQKNMCCDSWYIVKTLKVAKSIMDKDEEVNEFQLRPTWFTSPPLPNRMKSTRASITYPIPADVT